MCGSIAQVRIVVLIRECSNAMLIRGCSNDPDKRNGSDKTILRHFLFDLGPLSMLHQLLRRPEAPPLSHSPLFLRNPPFSPSSPPLPPFSPSSPPPPLISSPYPLSSSPFLQFLRPLLPLHIYTTSSAYSMGMDYSSTPFSSLSAFFSCCPHFPHIPSAPQGPPTLQETLYSQRLSSAPPPPPPLPLC